MMTTATPLEALLDEVRLTWHAMSRAGERLHARERVTLGMRGVLEFLALNGPSTVPHVARSRKVTRQHVQAIVNALVELRLAALAPNPAHERSPLIRLIPEGERVIQRMRERERRFFERAGTGRDEDGLRRAAEILRTVRETLGSRP